MFEKLKAPLSEKFINNFILFLFLFLLVSFVLSPLYMDIRIMLTSSFLSQFYDGNWVCQALQSWELKGALNRIFFYIIYRITTLFTPFASGYLFELIAKIIYTALILVVITFSAKIATEKNQSIRNIVFLICCAFFSVLIEAQMQCEMTSTLILILAFSIYINSKKEKFSKKTLLKQFIIGALLALIFFFKSILVLMSFSFAAAIILWNKLNNKTISKKEILAIFLGGCTTFFGGLFLIIKFAPYEIENIMNASIYQQTLISGIDINWRDITDRILKQSIYSLPALPIVLTGIAAGINNLVNDLRKKDFDSVSLRALMWIFPLLVIIIPNKFFCYHFFIIAFCSIFEFYVILKDGIIKKLQENVSKLDFALILTFILIFSLNIIISDLGACRGNQYFSAVKKVLIGFFSIEVLLSFTSFEKMKKIVNFKIAFIISSVFYFGHISVFSHNFINYMTQLNQMYKTNISIAQKLNLKPDEEVLYLDYGYGAYFLQRKPVLDEFNPLILERIGKYSPYRNHPRRLKNYKKAMLYKGRYIVFLEEWFINNKYEYLDIQNKIKTQYHYKDTMKIYKIGDLVINKNARVSAQRFIIYERNK